MEDAGLGGEVEGLVEVDDRQEVDDDEFRDVARRASRSGNDASSSMVPILLVVRNPLLPCPCPPSSITTSPALVVWKAGRVA